VRLRTVAIAVALATTLGVVSATAAQASRQPSARPSTAPAASPHFAGGPSAVPWSAVGRDWLLATWSPKAPKPSPYVAARQYLVLVSPAGARYLIAPLGARTLLLAWSGDGQRALLQVGSSPHLEVMDLHTGTVTHTFNVQQTSTRFFNTAGFTRPSGTGLYIDESAGRGSLLARFTLDGTRQVEYPTGFSRLGRFTGSWISSPSGTEVVMGAAKGLAIVSNDSGAVLKQLAISSTTYCTPERWWTASVVLANCGVPNRLYEFSVTGGTPKALTRSPRPPDAGDLSAWHVGRSVFVQVASACGYEYVAQLHGHTPVMEKIPGVSPGHTVYVIGASAQSLALQSSLVCNNSLSLFWFTPSTKAVRVVLGRPATSGAVSNAIIFPPPFG